MKKMATNSALSSGNSDMSSPLIFHLARKNEDLQKILDHNIGAFTNELPSMEWSLKGLQKQRSQDWEVYSIIEEKQIICVFLLKIMKGKIITFNTPIRMGYQGKGHSHTIKNHFEKYATSKNSEKIVHYCHESDHRAISLNETHHYIQVEKDDKDKSDYPEFLKWEKKISPRK